MKKNKDYLIISAIIMLIYIFYNLLITTKEGKFITNDMFITVCNIFELIMGIVGSIYFIYISSTEESLKSHRNGILFISILFLLFNLISGVIGIKVYKNIIDKRKKELPQLEDIKQNKYLSLLSLIICLILLFYVSNLISNYIFNTIIYILILFIMIFNYRKRIKRDFIAYKNNFNDYFLYSLKIWGISLLTLIGVNLIIRFITGMNNATNQETLNEAIKNYPIIISFLTILYAPIAEELMFRGVFKEFIKKKIPFIIISGFTFGLMHIIDDFTSYKELLYIFVYGTMGCYLAYLYYKTNNIFSNITFHFLQNALATIIMLIMTFLV